MTADPRVPPQQKDLLASRELPPEVPRQIGGDWRAVWLVVLQAACTGANGDASMTVQAPTTIINDFAFLIECSSLTKVDVSRPTPEREPTFPSDIHACARGHHLL
jgi:hypothetical protein